jgi:hypothetical protein
MKYVHDDIVLNAVESLQGLRALLLSIESNLRLRARANESDARTIRDAGYTIEASRQNYEADARVRNAELVGFVIENLHSYEPPPVAAAAAASASIEAPVPVESNDTSEPVTGETTSGPAPESTVEATG